MYADVYKRQTYNFLVALAFSQMFNLLCARADNTYGGRLPYHVRVLWDEAANTGQVPGLEKIVAVIRSREIRLTLFYQAMSECKALYKDHSETIDVYKRQSSGIMVRENPPLPGASAGWKSTSKERCRIRARTCLLYTSLPLTVWKGTGRIRKGHILTFNHFLHPLAAST